MDAVNRDKPCVEGDRLLWRGCSDTKVIWEKANRRQAASVVVPFGGAFLGVPGIIVMPTQGGAPPFATREPRGGVLFIATVGARNTRGNCQIAMVTKSCSALLPSTYCRRLPPSII